MMARKSFLLICCSILLSLLCVSTAFAGNCDPGSGPNSGYVYGGECYTVGSLCGTMDLYALDLNEENGAENLENLVSIAGSLGYSGSEVRKALTKGYTAFQSYINSQGGECLLIDPPQTGYYMGNRSFFAECSACFVTAYTPSKPGSMDCSLSGKSCFSLSCNENQAVCVAACEDVLVKNDYCKCTEGSGGTCCNGQCTQAEYRHTSCVGVCEK